MKKSISILMFVLFSIGLTTVFESCSSEDDDPTPAVVDGITIKTAPAKAVYYEGEVLDLSGLVVTLSMENGETKDVAFADFASNDITCSPENGTEVTNEISVVITHIPTGARANQSISYMTLTDVEGNVYQVVKIGDQFWTVENLKTTKYNDGTDIALETEFSEWKYLTTAAYCWYSNDESANKDTYGALYNWYAVNSDKLCPEGWHVPTDAEWTTLVDYLGGDNIAGDKLKESGSTHWGSSNTGATNESGFTALPGGYRDENYGAFNYMGGTGCWWTSTEDVDHTSSAWSRYLDSGSNDVPRYYRSKVFGFSVRCIKD